MEEFPELGHLNVKRLKDVQGTRMAHAVFEVETRVRRVLTAMLKGMLGE